MTQPRIEKQQLEKLLKDCTRRDICDHFGMSERTLDRLIQEYGLQRANMGRKDLSKQSIYDIRLLYRMGYTQDHIAERFNVSQSLVSKIVNKHVHKLSTDLSPTGAADVKLGLKYGN